MRTLPLYTKPRKRRLSPEASLQMTVCEHLRLRGCDGLLYFHPCNEGKRSAAEGARLLKMGMLPGIADLVISIPGQPLSFLELKAKGEKQTPEQIAFGTWAIETGRRYAIANNIDAALAVLVEWGAMPARPQRLYGRPERRAA